MDEINLPLLHTRATTFNHDPLKEQMSDPSIALESKAIAMLQAERSHHLYVRRTIQRQGVTFVGQENEFLHWLTRAEKLVDEITRSDDHPFEVTPGRRGQPHHRLTKIGNSLFLACKSYDHDIARHYKHHRFNPALTVMLKVAEQYSSEFWTLTCAGQPVPSDPRTREILESAIAFIRSSCRSQAYKDESDNYKRNEEKNIASCCEYLAAQFQRRSQLLVLRIDLYFRPAFKGWGYTREADSHYAKFLRALRENRIVPDVLGYIGKREDGIDRGIHFHVLVVLDGHKHRDAANLTRMVGEDWVRRCGHGEDSVDADETAKQPKASYFNCYTRTDQYLFNCLGLIHPTSTDKLRGLRLAIEYLCKESTQLKPRPLEGTLGTDPSSGKGTRNLRKGIMPKRHSGRGAPRSSGLYTSAIDRELLKNLGQ